MYGQKYIITLEQLIRKLNANKIDDFITSQSIYDSLSAAAKDVGSWHINNDARSATFFSYGLAQEKNAVTVLIVREDELTSCYTGLTEAKLEHVTVIVVCIQRGIHRHRYIEKCIDTEIQLIGEQAQAELESALANLNEYHSPVMIGIGDEKQKTDAKARRLGFLKNSGVKDFDRVICYDRYSEVPDIQVEFYSYEYRYGVLSKYLGFINGTNERVCLIAPDFAFELDVNSLNSRYLDKKFKVIVINEDDSPFKHENWVKNNAVNFTELSENDIEELNNHLCSDCPEIVYLTLKEN